MIQRVTIKNFLNHESFSIENLPSITVFIGENDTGKTGLLKLLYATTKSLEIFSRKNSSFGASYKKVLAEKLFTTFQPRKNGIGDLVYKGGKEKLSVDIRFKKSDKPSYQQDLRFSFGDSTTQNITEGNTEFSMSMTAEGIKKIGIITTLIRNRQLGKNTILFLDEPETSLHPKAVRELVEMIVKMSKAGVQILLSTHSYFVIKQLTNCAKRDNLEVLCCSLEKEKGKSVIANFSNLKDGLPDNPIVEEALKMFDEEIKIDLGL